MRIHRPTLFPGCSLLIAVLPLLLGVTECGEGSLIAAWNFNEAQGEQARQKWQDTIPATIGTGELSLEGWTGGTEDYQGTWLNGLFGEEGGSSLSLVAGPAVVGNGSILKISLSTEGYQRIKGSFAVRGSYYGFTEGRWYWSTDGRTFNQVPVDTSSTSRDWEVVTVDLSAVTAVDDQPDLMLVHALMGAGATAANIRLDNIRIHGEPIESPDAATSVAMSEAQPAS